MHDNTFVFPLALSWLRCYPGNLFSQLCTDFGISNKTKKMLYMDSLDHKFDASECAAEFFVLCWGWHCWGSVTSGQILTLSPDNSWHTHTHTHTFTYTTPPSAEGEEIFVYYAGSPAAAQLSRVKRFMETFLGTVWGPLERLFWSR